MACECNITLDNTGVPDCQNIMAVGRKLIVVPMVADDGTANNIDLINDTLNESYFSGKVNEADASKRWYPLPLIDNVEDVKGDPVTEALNSGANIFVQEGPRTFTGVMINQSAVFLGKLEEARCKNIGVYIVDKDGNLIGSVSSSGQYLNPIEVDNNTWNPRLVKTTDTTVQKVQVDFEFAQTEKDSNLRLITQAEAGYNLLGLDGLLDVNVVVSSPTTTGFTSTLTLDYGTALQGTKVKGWVIGDFSLYNNTTTSSITITSVTESADGVYDFVIPAQTGGDSLTLSADKDGFDVPDTTFTV